MIIYTLDDDVNDIKKGTKFTFNKSLQKFEALGDKEVYISNNAPFKVMVHIRIHRVLTAKSEVKKTIYIPF